MLLLLLAGCFQVPDDWVDQGLWTPLDYHLDRPRVLGVRLDPPIVAHGLPVRVDALALGPGEPRGARADLCGLRDDTWVTVGTVDCFTNRDLVTPVIDEVPGVWSPPDLSGLVVERTGTVLGDTPAGMTWWAALDTFDFPPGYSTVPLLVTARFPSGDAYGSLSLPVIHAPYVDGDPVPPSVHTRERALTWSGDARPGGRVDLRFAFQGRPHAQGFHWYVDAGELERTGRTAIEQERSDGWTETSNALDIPGGWSGPLRVAVVVASAEGAAAQALVGDITWEVLALPVEGG